MIISVLGCGWLGFPLAERLVSHEHIVKGSTTTPKKVNVLKQSDIQPFLLDLPESFDSEKTEKFWDCDLLFLNIPPGRRDPGVKENYPKIVEKVVEKAHTHSISWIVFTSSTSVYPKFGGITTEKDAEAGHATRPSGEALLEAEQTIMQSGIDYTILRLGGLYGYDRHPVKYLSGKKNLDGASKPVNLVHQLDCVNIITEIINQKKRNEIYNVVSDGHPPRKEFYECAAKHMDLELPTFKPDKESNYKIVSNEKLKNDLFYSFLYPNPMDHTP